jgi:hypothetical protein
MSDSQDSHEREHVKSAGSKRSKPTGRSRIRRADGRPLPDEGGGYDEDNEDVLKIFFGMRLPSARRLGQIAAIITGLAILARVLSSFF